MKRLMIIGASILQLPAIQKAKEMGLYVAVADYNPNAIGIPYADEYYNVSTIDEEGVYQAAKKFRADGIMTLATDMPMRSVSYACKKLGLTGISYDTAVKATDKGEMIKAFEKANVEHPWYYIIDDHGKPLPEGITYPCITKPTDNAGSRGVMLVGSREELEAALAYSAENGRSGAVIVEEYMAGPEVSVEVIVWQGVPHVLQITDKLTTGAPHFVEMGHSQPSRLAAEDQEKIRDLACRAVKAVGIDNGPAHVEIMLTKEGPKMVELGARMGGDCITTHLVPLSTGIDMIKATIDICLGLIPDIAPKFQKGSAIRFFDVPCGIIKAIEGVEEAKAIPGVQEIAFTKQVGDIAGDIGSSTDRAGFVIAQADSAEQAVVACEQVLRRVRIITSNN
ncbi:MAG: ATP-grasp domain-containing protein [Oscillospiraceae bacterium]|nr:ATP-grasp domain-containing protein [Oscillospiraceae bacterium]